jgi:cytochrome c biogenesis protein CcdA
MISFSSTAYLLGLAHFKSPCIVPIILHTSVSLSISTIFYEEKARSCTLAFYDAYFSLDAMK